MVFGGWENCEHVWVSTIKKGKTGGTASKKVRTKGTENFQIVPDSVSDTCTFCGAWRGQLGLEPTVQLFVQHLAMGFNEVKRVLRSDGVMYVVIGDSYSGSGGPGGQYKRKNDKHGGFEYFENPTKHVEGVADRNKLGVPWMFAHEMQKHGWVVRQEIIWAKGVSLIDEWSGSCMPEPRRGWRWERHRRRINDVYQDCPGCEKCLPHGNFVLKQHGWRPSTSHETIFMFTKSDKYYINDMGAREQAVSSDGYYETRNMRSVWCVSTKGYKGSHFATFPEGLVKPLIRTSTSDAGVCPICGMQWSPVRTQDGYINEWKPSCECGVGWKPVPAIVFDPFIGTGTTAIVAKELGRNYYGVDNSQEYVDIANSRLSETKKKDLWMQSSFINDDAIYISE